MKKLYTLLFAVFTFAAMVSTPTGAVPNYVNQKDADAIEVTSKAFTAFIDETNKETATIDTMKAKAAMAADELDKLSKLTFSTDLGSSYVTEAATLKAEAAKLRDKVNQFATVAATNDEVQIRAYFNDLQQQAKTFDDQLDKVNKAVDDSNKAAGSGYLWLVVVTAIVAVVSFVWAFVLGKKTTYAQPELVKAKRTVAYASLAPLAGALITFLTFTFAEQLGGSYYIAYGPVLFGAIFLVQALANYVKLSKTRVSQA